MDVILRKAIAVRLVWLVLRTKEDIVAAYEEAGKLSRCHCGKNFVDVSPKS